MTAPAITAILSSPLRQSQSLLMYTMSLMSTLCVTQVGRLLIVILLASVACLTKGFMPMKCDVSSPIHDSRLRWPVTSSLNRKPKVNKRNAIASFPDQAFLLRSTATADATSATSSQVATEDDHAFDIPAAIMLAGYAFDSYNEPVRILDSLLSLMIYTSTAHNQQDTNGYT